MRAIISTVGTSLLGNSKRGLSAQDISDESILEWMARTTPKDISAEVNTLSQLDLSTKEDNLYFLVSETPEGQRCADLLTQYYNSQGFVAESHVVKGVSFNTGQFRDFGMANIVRDVLRLCRKYDGSAIVNATGGFKAEAAYALLAGQLARVPVAYLHDEFRQMVFLPPMPIHFDYERFSEFEDNIDEVLHAQSRKEARHVLDNLPPDIQVLLEDTKKDSKNPYDLSPVGKALIESFDRTDDQLFDLSITSGKKGSHSTLFGDGVCDIHELPKDVQEFLQPILSIAGVKSLQLGRFSPRQNSDRPVGKYVALHDQGVQFKLVCREGWSTLLLITEVADREPIFSLVCNYINKRSYDAG